MSTTLPINTEVSPDNCLSILLKVSVVDNLDNESTLGLNPICAEISVTIKTENKIVNIIALI